MIKRHTKEYTYFFERTDLERIDIKFITVFLYIILLKIFFITAIG